jgi:hypothetical protein
VLGAVVASEGGYDLAPADAGTRVTIFNVLEGRGLGKLITPQRPQGPRRVREPDQDGCRGVVSRAGATPP